MKKCIFSVILLGLMSICLVGCTDKDYTREDADKLAKSYSKKCKFVDEQVIGEKETIWTYHDEKLDWDFTVHEYPYTASFDGSHWNARSLETNYDDLIADYILGLNEVKNEGFREYNGSPESIYVEVSDREDLQDKVKCLQEVLKEISKKTKRNSYRVGILFKLGNTSDDCALSSADLNDIEKKILKRAYIFYDETVLNEYSDKELKQFIKDNAEDEIQFVYKDDDKERTGIIVFSGNTWVSKKAFKHWLEENGYKVTDDEYGYCFTNIDGVEQSVICNTASAGDMLGFFEIIDMLGLKDIKVGYEK